LEADTPELGATRVKRAFYWFRSKMEAFSARKIALPIAKKTEDFPALERT
jgi:hypothetical protein